MNILDSVLLFFCGFLTRDVLSFIKSKINKKKEKSKQEIIEIKKKERTNLKSAIERLHHSCLSERDFGIHKNLRDYISIHSFERDVTAQELFDHIIKGLRYPIINDVKKKDAHIILGDKEEYVSLLIFIYASENRNQDENEQFILDLGECAENYINAGCPDGDGISSVEDIVSRARGEEKTFEQLVRRYGIAWRE